MNILADYHHTDLFHSLQLLFEKRLGYQLFRPIGIDWWENGYWKINDIEATAKQYLEVGNQPQDGTQPLNSGIGLHTGGWYSFYDIHNNTYNRALNFDQFKRMDIDIVIASIPQHIKPFKELAQMKNAKFIFQMGNRFENVIDHILEIPNLMASVKPFYVPSSTNTVFYRQEFDTSIFRPLDITPHKKITSFINVYQENLGFHNFLQLKELMPDWEVKSYGGQCRDGSMATTKEIARSMQESAWGFQVKYGADGYGHILHNWFACGRPVIINYIQYKKELGGELLILDETCLTSECETDMIDIANIIQNMTPEKYQWMCQRVREVFKKTVDFDKDAQDVKTFLDNLN